MTRIALTIAGSDSGGGAGIQADLKTFAALGVYGASAITALTAQNTRGVLSVRLTPPEMVLAQIDAALVDFDVAAIKMGMLGSAEIVEAVAGRLSGKIPSPQPSPASGRGGETLLPRRAFEERPSSTGFAGEGGPKGRMRAFIVYDPVMISSTGQSLSGESFVAEIRSRLLPLVDCLTPNLDEAAALLGQSPARNEDEMARQGAALLKLGPRAVLVKGGHLPGDEAVDILVTGAAVDRFAASRIASRNLHGTGCTLSSAIAAEFVLGAMLPEAVGKAKAFVRAAIERGRDFALGAGAGPLLQFPLKS